MPLRIAKRPYRPNHLKLAPIYDSTKSHSQNITGSEPHYSTSDTSVSSVNAIGNYNHGYPTAKISSNNTNIVFDNALADSDNASHLKPVDKTNDTVWNVARLTLYGKPEDDKRLHDYMMAGWEPFSTVKENHYHVLYLRRLEFIY